MGSSLRLKKVERRARREAHMYCSYNGLVTQIATESRILPIYNLIRKEGSAHALRYIVPPSVLLHAPWGALSNPPLCVDSVHGKTDDHR